MESTWRGRSAPRGDAPSPRVPRPDVPEPLGRAGPVGPGAGSPPCSHQARRTGTCGPLLARIFRIPAADLATGEETAGVTPKGKCHPQSAHGGAGRGWLLRARKPHPEPVPASCCPLPAGHRAGAGRCETLPSGGTLPPTESLGPLKQGGRHGASVLLTVASADRHLGQPGACLAPWLSGLAGPAEASVRLNQIPRGNRGR